MLFLTYTGKARFNFLEENRQVLLTKDEINGKIRDFLERSLLRKKMGKEIDQPMVTKEQVPQSPCIEIVASGYLQNI